MGYELALGPYGTAWRGPQRIVALVRGDRISGVTVEGGFAARGCAERLVAIDLQHSFPLVNRVCGVHGEHHALAWSLALEQLAGIEVPRRAQVLRMLVAEGERVASHLHAACVLLATIGLDGVHDRLVALRELGLRGQQIITGHRLVHEHVLPGGVQHNLYNEEAHDLGTLLAEQDATLRRLIEGLLRQRGLARRVSGVGRVPKDVAGRVGGIVARAAGAAVDVRRDEAYAAYDVHQPSLVQQRGGDVGSRLFILLLEAYASIQLARRLLRALPEGLWRGDPIAHVPAGSVRVVVEAPSGPLAYTIASDGRRLTDVRVEGPILVDELWQAALMGQAAEDAPLIVASLAPCILCAEA